MKAIPIKGNSRIFNIKNGKARLATKNIFPGKKLFSEEHFKIGKDEYRIWLPRKSKLAAAIMNGLKEVPIREGDTVLYLGAAAGQTASHVSDIVGEKGMVFCIEVGERTMRDLILNCEKRGNMFPILADANSPEKYSELVPECDVIYQDIAQPNQEEILQKNANQFLKKGGFAFVAIKARSIDVTQEPEQVFRRIETFLSKYFQILDKRRLEPYERDHEMILLRWWKHEI